MADTIQVLRAIHILAAITWGGAVLYRAHVIEKVLQDDEAARRFFATAPHGPFMAISALITVAVGGAVMGMNSDAYSLDAIGNGSWVLGLGMGFAVIALGLGFAVHMPTDMKLKPLAQARKSGQDHDEATYQKLVSKEALFGRISVALVSLSMLAMVTFRMF